MSGSFALLAPWPFGLDLAAQGATDQFGDANLFAPRFAG
jgi:hypothetical protein